MSLELLITMLLLLTVTYTTPSTLICLTYAATARLVPDTSQAWRYV